MKLSVNSQAIEITDYEMTVSGSSGIYEVEFTFTSDWDGYGKTAEFRNGSTVVQSAITSNKASIPYAALSPGGTFEIGVYGAKTVSSVTYKKPTVWTPPILISEGCVIGTAVPDPSQSVYDEIMEACEEAVSTAEAVEERADEGEFVPVFTVNSTTTGAAGTSASVSVDTTDVYHPKFDFTIPKGDTGAKGDTGNTGNGIASISKTSTSGLSDIYTITFTDGTTTTFNVTNGKGISSIAKTSTSGLIDTYTVTFNDGSTTTFDVTNGEKGDKGDKGDIANVTATEYQASASGSVVPTGTWQSTIPTLAGGTFLWTRFTWNTTPATYSYVVARQGMDGSGSGDMLASVYDSDSAVAVAGGIKAYVDANGGKIDHIKVNGTEQTITNKTVDLDVPTELADLTDDSTHRVVTDTEKTTWNGKQDAIPANTYDAYGSAAAVQTNLNTHAGDTTAHITASERTTWNGKQDTLTAGDNITINNNVISASVACTVQNEILTLTGTSYQVTNEVLYI